MKNILDTIVAEKKLEVAKLRPQADKLRQAAVARKDFRDFGGALRRKTSTPFELLGLTKTVALRHCRS